MNATPFERHLAFIEEDTLAANAEVYLYIQDDKTWGLRVPADSGYVKNDGPGTLTVRNSDDGEHYSKAVTLKPYEQITWEHDDDVWNHTVHLEADVSGASFRSRFARSRW